MIKERECDLDLNAFRLCSTADPIFCGLYTTGYVVGELVSKVTSLHRKFLILIN